MESFFHSLKAELLHGVTFLTATALRRQRHPLLAVLQRDRLHSALGFYSPMAFERLIW